MTNSNTPPPPPALTLVEKLYAVHNINSLVPEKLDLQESNYSTWSYFFKGHCSNFNVLNHIDGSTSTSDPPTDEWITADSIVKSWIFLTLSPTLRKRMISTNPASAKAAWDTIETIFQENKRTRTVALKGELRVIQMGDDTPDAYFSKIDSIITLLTDLGSTMDDDDIVTYAINGLSEKYGSLAQIIAHKDPFPDLATVRTMVTTEEMRLRSKQPILSTSTTSSSPQVLLATSQPRIQDNRNNRDRDARNENKTEICRNFGRGYCRWGTNCRFIHASPKGTNNPRPNSSQHNTRSMQQGPGHTGLNSASQQHLLSLIQAQQNLLAQYGLSISQGQQPVQHNNTMGLRPNAPPGFQQTQPHQPTFGFNGHQQALYSAAVQNQSASSGSTSQETQLPHAFNTLTLQDPANSNWNMDTGASSHLNSSVNNLSTIFNSRIYPSVLVGDGKSIPVTNTGHSTLPTPYRTLHLNNVLITPNIVKNLISVRQFVRENKCTIEFDEFGFSIKGFLGTRQIILRRWTVRVTLSRLYKARHVANGSTQLAEVLKWIETFSSGCQTATIRDYYSVSPLSRHWLVPKLACQECLFTWDRYQRLYNMAPPLVFGIRSIRSCLPYQDLFMGLNRPLERLVLEIAAYAARQIITSLQLQGSHD
ncbi:hybrid signal transduction histidine kinase M [Tanacetum coccineum]